MWNFSDTVRVCFTCFRVMGEEGRKGYEHRAAKSAPKTPAQAKPAGRSWKTVGVLALLGAILAAGLFYYYQPLNARVAEHHLAVRESRAPVRR